MSLERDLARLEGEAVAGDGVPDAKAVRVAELRRQLAQMRDKLTMGGTIDLFPGPEAAEADM